MTTCSVPLTPVPGPRGLPVLGNLPEFGRDPLAFLTRLRDEFGDAVRWSLGPRPSLFLSHPEHIAELLGARERAYDILDIGWAFKRVVGQSVIMSKGEDWRRKRSLVQPTVRPRQVRAYAATMVDCARSAADGWRDGDRVDVRHQMALITQRVVLRCLFGNDLGDRTRALADAMNVAEQVIGAELRGMSLFLPGWVTTPARQRLRAAVSTIDAEVHRLIRARLREGRPQGGGAEAGRDDLLSRLLAARDEQGRPLSPREVRDEAVTLWAAGHETTSTALTWTWHLLSASPSARDRLETELDRVLGGRPPTIDDHDRLTWTQQIVKEALRLYPPAWLLAGVAREGATLGGTRLPAGTVVWCSPWTTHRDPRWFPRSTEFRPERWDGDSPDPVPDHAWYPFGGGQRTCLGARFAQVEAVLVLATLAQRFRLDLPPTPVTPRAALLLQPSAPLLATVRATGR
ncbi:cytochrome P450 [Streptomyces ficellus]|uniref:Cytochrome P450 n=1 Tax=Streptomyces ficellus TaxID=1977088 RepID=A0A6I6F5D6_9ACTN|nr:cytochrome P450 [Streptomyces ficellus]QGV78131.1 cytochrome P450 [Streptomyces ficellus]